MLFSFVLISCSLLATAVLAVPPPKLDQPHFLNALKRSTDDNSPGQDKADKPEVAGAVLRRKTVNTVAANITIPEVKGAVGSGGDAYIGIDGIVCSRILRAGVQFLVTDHGPAYKGFSQFFPGNLVSFDVPISPGDRVEFSVGAISRTVGLATIRNFSTGKSAYQTLESPSPLCMNDAVWLVTRTVGRSLADFGEVNFENAEATGGGKTYTFHGVTTEDITINHLHLTKTSVHGTTVTIKYV